jgi:SMC interacting uncharacterized protein involved in chromosome segregation
MGDARQPSQPSLANARMLMDERREHEDRVIAAINTSFTALSGQIATVQTEVRSMKEANGKDAVTHAVEITKLDNRISTLEERHKTDVGKLELRVEPIEKAFWKWSAISAAIAVAIGAAHELFPFFHVGK